jgi:hypothetical protein
MGHQFFWSVGSWAREGMYLISDLFVCFACTRNILSCLADAICICIFICKFDFSLHPCFLKFHFHWCCMMLTQSLATQVRKQLNASRTKGEPIQGFNFSTTTLITRYLQVWQILTLFQELRLFLFFLHICGLNWTLISDCLSNKQL